MTKRLMIARLVSLGLAVAGCASNKNKKDDDMAAEKKQKQAKKDEEAPAEREKLEARIEKLESQLERARMLAKSRKQMQKDLEDELSSLVDAGKIKLTTRRGLLVVRIPREVLFESGKFELEDKGKKTLKSVASELMD